jgi:hypothetical protein
LIGDVAVDDVTGKGHLAEVAAASQNANVMQENKCCVSSYHVAIVCVMRTRLLQCQTNAAITPRLMSPTTPTKTKPTIAAVVTVLRP